MSTSTCKDIFRKYLCCCCLSPPPQTSLNQSGTYIDNTLIQLSQNIHDNNLRNRLKASIQIDRRYNYGKKLHQLFSKKKNWQIVSGSSIYEDKTCSICLADKANIKLECNHYFHKPCLWTWYKSKNSCPNCRRKTTYLDIFCQDCYYQFHKISLMEAMKEKTVDSYGSPIFSICDSCQQNQQKQKLKQKQKEIKKQQKIGANCSIYICK